ncbi:hypothetical protein NUW54_g11923 [Trametes sanguinea]|uniref:Uncharacterized protein n=1 Tax=Trametes sanguinea TaxID=158606 RepID=A0ACC1N5H2_9APHY|nr:hypothetical protein NUW54_g11923 [Trametes sanguinea]
MNGKPNGHLHLGEADHSAASPDTPASYYFGEGDARPPGPEELEARLHTVAGGVVERVAREARRGRMARMFGRLADFVGGGWVGMHDGVHDAGPRHGGDDCGGTQLTRQSEKFPRYRQRLDSTGKLFRGALFVDDPDFDVFDHIRVRRLPEPAGKAELDALVGDFIAEPWDLSRPLWDMILVENYHDDDGAVCAVVARGCVSAGLRSTFLELTVHLMQSPHTSRWTGLCDQSALHDILLRRPARDDGRCGEQAP